jgi:saccharopine dehydrogenase-like NADP-dependent oxidoreductase
MSKKIVQLGYGKMGKTVLNDLLKTAEFDALVVADAGPNFNVEINAITDPRVKSVKLDVDDRAGLLDLIKGADVVVELLPVRYTMQVAQAAVDAGTHMVSSVFIIDWSIQDADGARRQQEQMAQINRAAQEKGLTVLKEFGMDPGLDLVIAGETVRQLDEVQALYTYGAGFPEHRLSKANPIGYKFTWSIIDTMCSYSIPGRTIKNGQAHEVPADGMFVPGNFHILDLKEMGGPLECFVNGDGESLARLFPAIAKTATTLGRFICRWPGHAAFWEVMVKSGFNRMEPVKVNGVDVIPAAFCAALLGSQPQFHYGQGERDVALIRADARGYKNGKPTRVVNQLVDYRDLETGYTAMQRTVAFPMSIGAQMIMDGRLSKRGIVEPSEVPFEPFIAELHKRHLDIIQTVKNWDGSLEPGGE